MLHSLFNHLQQTWGWLLVCQLISLKSQPALHPVVPQFLLLILKFSYFVGKHLAEHCRAEYSKVPNFILWILAESAIVACDIPEGMSAVYGI